MDQYDDGRSGEHKDPLKPLNAKKKPDRLTAVALSYDLGGLDAPLVTAAGRGKIAEQILQIAYENGIKVREDSALAEMLAAVEIDSPIPSEAFMAVAEILAYIYKANNEATPFDAVFDNAMDKGDTAQRDDKDGEEE